MNKRQALVAAALAGLCTTVTVNAVAHDAPATNGDKEKCYGVAKAGLNDCASADGTHSCAGQATQDNLPAEWAYIAKGTCTQAGGSLKPVKAPKKAQ